MPIKWTEFVAAVEDTMREHGVPREAAEIEYMDFSWAEKPSDINIVVEADAAPVPLLTASN